MFVSISALNYPKGYATHAAVKYFMCMKVSNLTVLGEGGGERTVFY